MVKTCPICGKEIKKQRARHAKTFCSTKCRGRWWSTQHPIKYVERECPNCHKKFKADNSQVKAGNYKFCSNQCRYDYNRGANAYNYKGGWIRPDGYRQISVDGKQYLEHRCVMEKQIGRKLKSNEHVHHKNGNKLDNDPSNLEIKVDKIHASEHAKGRKHKPIAINRMKLIASKRKRNARGLFITG